MANGAVAILRVMFNWAVEDAKLLRTNPCLGVKAIKYTGGTNHVWTDEEMMRFEEAYPLGTRERLAYALLLYSGQRSADIVRLGRQHLKDGWLTITAGKTGKAAQVPVLDVLSEAIAAGPTGDLHVPGQRRAHAAPGVDLRPLVPRGLRPGWGAGLHAARPQARGRHPLGRARRFDRHAPVHLRLVAADGGTLHQDRQPQAVSRAGHPPAQPRSVMKMESIARAIRFAVVFPIVFVMVIAMLSFALGFVAESAKQHRVDSARSHTVAAKAKP